jgi:hypothetical protein
MVDDEISVWSFLAGFFAAFFGVVLYWLGIRPETA